MQYLPPVKIGHTGNSARVGTFDLTRFDEVSGLLFANLRGIPVSLIKKYPYLSAEMLTSEPEVMALAMLGGDAPHHPIPGLDQFDRIPGPEGTIGFNDVPVFRACSKDGYDFGNDYIKQALAAHLVRRDLVQNIKNEQLQEARFSRAVERGEIWASHFQKGTNMDMDKTIDDVAADEMSEGEGDRVAALESRLDALEETISELTVMLDAAEGEDVETYEDKLEAEGEDALADDIDDEEDEADALANDIDDEEEDEMEFKKSARNRAVFRRLRSVEKELHDMKTAEARRSRKAGLAQTRARLEALQASGHFVGEISPETVTAVFSRSDRDAYLDALANLPSALPEPGRMFSRITAGSSDMAEASHYGCVTDETIRKMNDPKTRVVNK